MKKSVKMSFAALLAGGVLFGQFAQTATANATGFNDVTAVNPYGSYISDLQSKGVVVGYAGNFNPSATLTRAEFCTMLVRAFNLSMSSAPVKFADSRGHWGAQYIQSAYESGAVAGTSDSTFEPDAKVRREEAAAMVWRLLSKNGIATTTESVQASDADSWAADAVKNVLGYKLYGVEVKNGAYLSQDAMTRQQAAALFDLALKVPPTPKQVVVNPTSNPTNLIDQADGSQQLGNITLPPSIVQGNGISQGTLKANLGLMSKATFKVDGNSVTVSVPATGNDSLEWYISDDTNHSHWEGTEAKTQSFQNTSSVSIALMDMNTSDVEGACSLVFKNGQWSAQYPTT